MLDLPPPVSKNVYQKHSKDVLKSTVAQAQASMEQARHEVLDLYDADAEAGEVADILVSCDGTRQKRGFTLYGACFVIAHETSKVVDNAVMSKHCVGCHRWEKWDKTSSEYLEWKASHVCGANYEDSSGGMEPHGMVKLFQRSLDFHIRYKYLISDGDSKAHSMILESQPYGSSCQVEAVQATLLHYNSTDAAPRHHLCPPGEDSWCKYQVALAKNEAYTHHHEPIPEAIV